MTVVFTAAVVARNNIKQSTFAIRRNNNNTVAKMPRSHIWDQICVHRRNQNRNSPCIAVMAAVLDCAR